MDLNQLDEALLEAHSKNKESHSNLISLVDLYRQAYELTVHNNETAGYFYLTHAYVYALDSDHEDVEAIEQLLRQAGRL